MSSCSFLGSSETLGPALKDNTDVCIWRGLTGKCLLPCWQDWSPGSEDLTLRSKGNPCFVAIQY